DGSFDGASKFNARRQDDTRQIGATLSLLLKLAKTFCPVAPERGLLSLISEKFTQGNTPTACPNNSDRLQHTGEKVTASERKIKLGANSSNEIVRDTVNRRKATLLPRPLSRPGVPTIPPARLLRGRSVARLACCGRLPRYLC